MFNRFNSFQRLLSSNWSNHACTKTSKDKKKNNEIYGDQLVSLSNGLDSYNYVRTGLRLKPNWYSFKKWFICLSYSVLLKFIKTLNEQPLQDYAGKYVLHCAYPFIIIYSIIELLSIYISAKFSRRLQITFRTLWA